jgi:diacylglycerol kinase family enzyme
LKTPDKTPGAKIYVETDGELVGTLPAEITVVSDALTLLAPAR